MVTIRFAPAVCRPCPVRSCCTRSAKRGRLLSVDPQPEYEALQAARQRQTTEAFQTQYAARAGIEGTLSQAVRRAGLRRARYLGLAKTHLQHLATAAALNLLRVAAWLADTPLAQTRRSAFRALAFAAT